MLVRRLINMSAMIARSFANAISVCVIPRLPDRFSPRIFRGPPIATLPEVLNNLPGQLDHKVKVRASEWTDPHIPCGTQQLASSRRDKPVLNRRSAVPRMTAVVRAASGLARTRRKRKSPRRFGVHLENPAKELSAR